MIMTPALTANLTVKQLMATNPVMVSPRETVHEAVRLMASLRIGAVLVVEDGKLLGIFTERDLLRHTAEAAPGWRQEPLADWMTREPHTIAPNATWEQARALMDELHIRHLPVVDDGRIVGIVAGRALIARTNELLNATVTERTQELRTAYERLRARDAELRLHMTMAGRLQARLLPAAPPDWPEITWAAHYQPLDPLGGDHYDFAQPDDRRFGVFIADATGHSIPAALVAIMTRAAFVGATRATLQPAAVLAGMNRRLYGLTGEHFVSAFFGVYDRTSRVFSYANAGHPFPRRYDQAASRCEPLALSGLLLGVMPEADYEEASVRLNPGDRLLFFTDGVTECRGAGEATFGDARVEEVLAANHDQSARTVVQRLVDQLTAFRGNHPLHDDITILAAELK
jgi:serine phosphatase RsbU (regulator of sigma subunit)/CBS domain-containing protein